MYAGTTIRQVRYAYEDKAYGSFEVKKTHLLYIDSIIVEATTSETIEPTSSTLKSIHRKESPLRIEHPRYKAREFPRLLIVSSPHWNWVL